MKLCINTPKTWFAASKTKLDVQIKKQNVYELTYELPNNLWVRILEKEDQKSLFLLNLLCINHDTQELFLSDDL